MATAAVIAPTPSALAVTYETAPPFCDGDVIHDYLAPIERMPTLHTPPSTGRVGFGPASLRLIPAPSLLVGEGTVGYKLSLRRKSPTAHLDWDVTTTLARVDWRGRMVSIQERARRHVDTVSRERGAGVQFTVSNKPAPYRVTAVFRSDSGQKLGGFGFYFRVVAPTQNARLGLNATSYRSGHTIFGRIEDFGTTPVYYGAPYAIERFDAGTWIQAPESPRGPWILPLYGTGPGLSADHCSGFWVPPSMETGHYRMSKEAKFGALLRRYASEPVTLSAEFDVIR